MPFSTELFDVQPDSFDGDIQAWARGALADVTWGSSCSSSEYGVGHGLPEPSREGLHEWECIQVSDDHSSHTEEQLESLASSPCPAEWSRDWSKHSSSSDSTVVSVVSDAPAQAGSKRRAVKHCSSGSSARAGPVEVVVSDSSTEDSQRRNHPSTSRRDGSTSEQDRPTSGRARSTSGQGRVGEQTKKRSAVSAAAAAEWAQNNSKKLRSSAESCASSSGQVEGDAWSGKMEQPPSKTERRVRKMEYSRSYRQMQKDQTSKLSAELEAKQEENEGLLRRVAELEASNEKLKNIVTALPTNEEGRRVLQAAALRSELAQAKAEKAELQALVQGFFGQVGEWQTRCSANKDESR